jgi:hypothetical protein
VNPRILIREITGSFPHVIQAMYVTDQFLNNKSILNVLQKNEDYSLKFLVGYLNSKLISFYHKRQTVKGSRNLFPKLVIKDLQNYPLPKINKEIQKSIELLVEKTLESKQYGQDSTEFEKQIDEMVYGLYGITEEERKVIEGNKLKKSL